MPDHGEECLQCLRGTQPARQDLSRLQRCGVLEPRRHQHAGRPGRLRNRPGREGANGSCTCGNPRAPALIWTDFHVIVNRRFTMPSELQTDPGCCAEPSSAPELAPRPIEGPGADEELALLAKAIGHPARVRILRILSQKEARVCSQLAGELPLAQSTVSEHLRILKDAGLIRSREDGPRAGYCINFGTLRRLKALVAII